MSNRRTKEGALKKGFFLFPLILALVFTAIACVVFFCTPAKSLVGLFFGEKAPTFSETKEFDTTKILSTDSGEIPLETFVYPESGSAYGVLKIPNANISADVYWGDATAQLNKGLGTYKGSFLPGFGSTTLIAGHNNTYFKNLGKVNIGDIITIETTWGTYTYEVSGTRIADKSDTSAYDLSAKEENLILYTCYPIDEIGLTSQRFFVYGKYISGPHIVK